MHLGTHGRHPSLIDRMATIWLPEPLKKHLRPLPQWAPIALTRPQTAVQVRFVTSDAVLDVTQACVVAALIPFVLAAGLPRQAAERLRDRPGEFSVLQFVDLESRRIVAQLTLRLRSLEALAAPAPDASAPGRHAADMPPADPDASLCLFDVTSGHHRCVPWPHRNWNTWLQARTTLRKNPGSLAMSPEAIQQTMIFYTCPRPVVLVSVDDGEHSNLFPMDLIGPISRNRFTLALRSTSPSIATMKAARRVALCDMPAALTPVIYTLGEHHKQLSIAWDKLPFGMQRSRLFCLPCPEGALRIRELEILEHDCIGSHTLFVTRVVSQVIQREGPQLFHTNGNYQSFRSRAAHAFPLAAAVP